MPTILAAVVLSACTADTGTGFHASRISADQPSPSAAPSASASGTPSTPLSPTVAPAYKSLAWYVAQAPTFPGAATATGAAAHGRFGAVLAPVADRAEGRLHHHRRRWAGPPVRGADFIREAHIPVTMFLNSPAATEYTDYFRQIEAAGGVVENHTINHNSLKGRSYSYQKHEICGSADKLESLFGKRSTLFRPRSASATRPRRRPHTTAG
ncbi:hypothetical protein GCM10027614_69920 [Micromonospora vulcania]